MRKPAGRFASAVTDSLWSFVALGGRAVASLVTFLVLTRALGDERFGFYIAIVAMAGIAKPLSLLGAPDLLGRDVAREPAALPASMRRVMRAVLRIGSITFLVLLGVAALAIPELSITHVAVLAAAELLSYAIPETVAKGLNALRRFAAGAMVLLALGVGRAAVAVVLWQTDATTVGPFAWGFLGVTVAVSAAAWALLPRGGSSEILPVVSAEGAAFAGSHVSATIQNDVDKTMLVAISGGAEGGTYGAGYRLVQYSLLPIQSLLAATYPRFFRRGVDGAQSTRSYAKKLLVPILAYTVPMGIALAVLASLLARVVGGDFEDVDLVITAMAGFPTVFALQTLFGDALVGSGHERFRATAAAFAAMANIVLNIVLIPEFGWRGAVVATYIVEALLLIVSYVQLHRVGRPQRTQATV